MASIQVVSTTQTSIAVQITGMDPNYSGNTRYIHWYVDGTEKTPSVEVSGAPSTGGYKNITGLTAGTTYTITATVNAEGWGSAVTIGTITQATDSATPTITPFSWSASNGSATRTQTANAYQAVNYGRAVSEFSHLVWNDMVDKVKEILDAKGWSWATNSTQGATLSYSNTRMTSSPYTLTAAKFNSLRFNIGSHVSTNISKVETGYTVVGSYFTRLVDCMNDMISL